MSWQSFTHSEIFNNTEAQKHYIINQPNYIMNLRKIKKNDNFIFEIHV